MKLFSVFTLDQYIYITYLYIYITIFISAWYKLNIPSIGNIQIHIFLVFIFALLSLIISHHWVFDIVILGENEDLDNLKENGIHQMHLTRYIPSDSEIQIKEKPQI